MRLPEVSRIVQVPDDVDVTVAGKVVTVKGTKGTLIRDFSHASVEMEGQGKEVKIWAKWPRKKESALVGTLESHIKNMIKGVTSGYTYKMKIVFSHFPISVKVQGRSVLIENFTGERRPRHVKILGDVKVKIDNEDVVIEGINLEQVSQTAANIEQSTKVRGKDPRVFLDGIYVYEQNEGMA
ncbi:MAG: 50S ribosomal protein L6 [Candidatus Bathyarchaeota archaeon]|nr:50S ribosomal protein L6 [Candidatus Bathyarchaeota archaeon]